MDGDFVEVWAFRERKGLRGEVIAVLKRNRVTVSGIYRERMKRSFIIPFAPIPYYVEIPWEHKASARDGDMVVAEIIPPGSVARTRTVAAKIMRLIDIPETAGDDLRSVAVKYGLPWGFPDEVEKEAQKAALVEMGSEASRRRDLRGRVLFTIDGVTARDYDDAVGIEALQDGSWLLTVAIADVAHVVKQGSRLDQEARLRGSASTSPRWLYPCCPRYCPTAS
jgi:exoribonuclease R